MKLLVLSSLLVATSAGAQAPNTMRLDYYHTGNALTEIFSVHEVVAEPLPWPGQLSKPIDKTNRGLYLFEVVDPLTGKTEYSRGFSSIFGEWHTTSEARQMHRTFHESIRFPEPDGPRRLRISKRDDANRFAAIWTAEINPQDLQVARVPKPNAGAVITLQESGHPSEKVDYLVIADGYAEEEAEQFEADARRLMESLFAVSPFRERRTDFNVWGIHVPAKESGTNRPSNGTYRWSPTGTTYDAFRSERYILAFDNRGLRDLAQYAPYEFILILANADTYGGGGIFGLYSTAAAGSDWAPYLVVHELGHHFAALADEYYTSSVAYEASDRRIEPWEPNVTALHDPANLKWSEHVERRTPVPTPWPKAEFESFQQENQARRRKLRANNRPEAEMNQLFLNEQAHVEALFSEAPHRKAIGAFEGANYAAAGYYRSEMNCLMFTRSEEFCHVCRDAIEDIINLYTP